MMRRLLAISLVLSTHYFASYATAATYAVYGAGTLSCGTWIEERKKENWYDTGQWIVGYISAAGYYGNPSLRKTDSDAIAVFMDNYCQAHPLEDIVQALVEQLRR